MRARPAIGIGILVDAQGKCGGIDIRFVILSFATRRGVGDGLDMPRVEHLRKRDRAFGRLLDAGRRSEGIRIFVFLGHSASAVARALIKPELGMTTP